MMIDNDDVVSYGIEISSDIVVDDDNDDFVSNGIVMSNDIDVDDDNDNDE